MTPEQKTITINLDQSDANRKIESVNLIQKACYENLRDKIGHDISRARSYQNAPPYPLSSGLVYFIDGTRGAGKSTFLESAYEALSKDDAFKKVEIIKDKPADLNIQLDKLANIDPSRIEDNEVILLPILKELNLKVQSLNKSSSSMKEENSDQEFRRIFKKLAGGLSLFAKGNDQLKDLDSELFLDWGLERARYGKQLRNNLHALIDETCKLCRVNGLILAFDDADTNAVHARAVLECIRKYLDTPQLVVLVTGDMELYSQLVRDHFYDNLGNHLNKMDKERDRQRTRMVDHLEDQYLLKLFPISRRIQLRPLWNLLVKSQSNMSVYESWEIKDRGIEDSIKGLIKRGIRLKDSRDVDLYYEFLLKQPIRSVLQVLSRCASYLDEKKKMNGMMSYHVL